MHCNFKRGERVGEHMQCYGPAIVSLEEVALSKHSLVLFHSFSVTPAVDAINCQLLNVSHAFHNLIISFIFLLSRHG